MGSMPQSPRGRDIEHVDGTPSEIIARGTAIETLGIQMKASADTLEDIKNRAIDDGTQKGKAIEALRESVGDSYSTLREAGELYEPVGPVIRTYGEELEIVKPKLDGHADDCESLWLTFQSLPGEVEPRGTGGLFGPEEGSPEAEQQAEEDEAKKAAYDAWVAEAELFDADYDTWETAYDEAVNNIGDKMAGSIKDGFWEFLEDLGQILSWAALIVGVAALIIGGPILAALALATALAYLAVTSIQYFGGKKSLLDVGLATLGVLPFGKLAGLTKLAHLNKLGLKAFGKAGLGNFAKLRGLFARPTLGKDGLIKIFQNRGTRAGFNKLLTGNTSFKDVYRVHKQFWPGIANAGVRNGPAVRNLAMIDYGLGIVSNALGHYGRVASATGLTPLPDLPKTPSWVGVGL